eukprot:TRINITY_DN21522_c0_g1_i1.p1 TRINITY_DN21522_c0_g1~~TRINITY_DN21522_c0_g1_i1.p1  ORF type:complete len:618 (+),score=181.43 TRINITY_DN21522_c0_g1_i1:181-2034(+)
MTIPSAHAVWAVLCLCAVKASGQASYTADVVLAPGVDNTIDFFNGSVGSDAILTKVVFTVNDMACVNPTEHPSIRFTHLSPAASALALGTQFQRLFEMPWDREGMVANIDRFYTEEELNMQEFYVENFASPCAANVTMELHLIRQGLGTSDKSIRVPVPVHDASQLKQCVTFNSTYRLLTSLQAKCPLSIEVAGTYINSSTAIDNPVWIPFADSGCTEVTFHYERVDSACENTYVIFRFAPAPSSDGSAPLPSAAPTPTPAEPGSMVPLVKVEVSDPVTLGPLESHSWKLGLFGSVVQRVVIKNTAPAPSRDSVCSGGYRVAKVLVEARIAQVVSIGFDGAEAAVDVDIFTPNSQEVPIKVYNMEPQCGKLELSASVETLLVAANSQKVIEASIPLAVSDHSYVGSAEICLHLDKEHTVIEKVSYTPKCDTSQQDVVMWVGGKSFGNLAGLVSNTIGVAQTGVKEGDCTPIEVEYAIVGCPRVSKYTEVAFKFTTSSLALVQSTPVPTPVPTPPPTPAPPSPPSPHASTPAPPKTDDNYVMLPLFVLLGVVGVVALLFGGVCLRRRLRGPQPTNNSPRGKRKNQEAPPPHEDALLDSPYVCHEADIGVPDDELQIID